MEDDANLWRVPGLAPSIVVRDMLGLRLGNYTTHHSATTFRDSARLYRRHGYGFVTPALSALAAHMPHVNFKVVSRALLHSRVSKRVTDFLWRLITGKLFMGEDAFTYLTRRSMVPHLRDKYQFCPYCPVQTRATQQHLIWDCPSLSGYWRLIRQLMSNLQLPRLALAQSVDSVSGLLSFITKEPADPAMMRLQLLGVHDHCCILLSLVAWLPQHSPCTTLMKTTPGPTAPRTCCRCA